MTSKERVDRLHPLFTVGQSVTSIGFIDCFGRQRAEVGGLTVVHVEICDTKYKPHVRVTAEKPGHQHEASQRFFESAD